MTKQEQKSVRSLRGAKNRNRCAKNRNRFESGVYK